MSKASRGRRRSISNDRISCAAEHSASEPHSEVRCAALIWQMPHPNMQGVFHPNMQGVFHPNMQGVFHPNMAGGLRLRRRVGRRQRRGRS
eukprot:514049-Prymnesium_polylepis.1